MYLKRRVETSDAWIYFPVRSETIRNGVGKGLVGDIVKIFLYYINIWEHIGPETQILGLTQARPGPLGPKIRISGPGRAQPQDLWSVFFQKKKIESICFGYFC